MTLNELVRHFELFGVCIPCRRMEPIDVPTLVANGGGETTVEDVRRRVRCGRCRQRTSDIRIVYSGSCGHARGFHYRD